MYFVRPCRNKNKFFPEGEIYFQPGATPQADEPLGFQPANGTNRGHSAECPYRLRVFCSVSIICRDEMYFVRHARIKTNFSLKGKSIHQPANGTIRGHSAECPYRLRVFCCVSIICRDEMYFVRHARIKTNFSLKGKSISSLGQRPRYVC